MHVPAPHPATCQRSQTPGPGSQGGQRGQEAIAVLVGFSADQGASGKRGPQSAGQTSGAPAEVQSKASGT